MPALLFPTDDVLRLALVAGVIPAEVAAEQVGGGVEPHGRPWVDVSPDLHREIAPALHRLGAVPCHQANGVVIFDCWYQLLSLLRDESIRPGPVCVELADAEVAGRRLSDGADTIHLLNGRRCLVTLSTGTRIDAPQYSEQASGVWVRSGWSHPLAASIPLPAGGFLLLDPGRVWRAIPTATAFRQISTVPVVGKKSVVWVTLPRSVTIRLRLRARLVPVAKQLWVLNDPTAWNDFLRNTDGRTLRAVRTTILSDGRGGWRFLIKQKGSAEAGLPAVSGVAMSEQPDSPGLFVPAGEVLTPTVRRDKLAAEIGLPVGGLAWVDSSGVNRCATTFCPAADFVEYTAPPFLRLVTNWGVTTTFDFDPVGPVLEAEPTHETVPQARETDSWLTRSFGRMAMKVSQSRPVPPQAPRTLPANVPASSPEVPSPSASAARRGELEERLVCRLHHLPAPERAGLWAATAGVLRGACGDAGLCWANAIWESADPPAAWFGEWLRAESRLARLDVPPDTLGEYLTLTSRRVPSRLVAAYLAWCGSLDTPPADLHLRIPRLVDLLADRADCASVRAAWLGRVAAAYLTGGDPLALARFRDIVFRRLAEGGTALDLDAPGFVRFYGRPGGDRLPAARDWLLRMRDPAHRWLTRQATPRRLQWFGLDIETEATAGYLDLLFAWGAARLGERAAARDWEETAAGALARPSGAADAGVHGVLLAAFRYRVREALTARTERSGLPPEVTPAYLELSDFQRYAVDKFRAACGVLEPADRVNPFHGRDDTVLFGDDPLGKKLRRLAVSAPGDDDTRAVRTALAAATADPTPGAIPRAVLAALGVAGRLPPDAARDVLLQVPAAVRGLGEWAWVRRDTSRSARVEVLLSRLLDAACFFAAVLNAPDVPLELVRDVTGPAGPPAEILQAAVTPIAGRFFRSLRKLGLRAETEAILSRVATKAPESSDQVGFAVGYMTVGAEGAAGRLLDAARDRLFSAGDTPNPRMKLATAYAAALGHAPLRMALGRLEELLQRLDGAVPGTSADRFFNVPALGLVDAVVRAVVSDDFALGSTVRGWLDDYEAGTRRRISRDLEAALSDG